METNPTWRCVVTLALLVLLSSPALAQSGEISGFTVDNVTELGTDFDLATERFALNGLTERIINIDDCLAYEGQSAEFVIGLDAPETGDLIVKLNAPGTTCNNNTISEESECITLHKESDWSESSLTFDVTMNELMFGSTVDDCLSAEREESFDIYFMHQPTSAASPNSSSIPFRLDLKAPQAPTIETSGGGDGQITVGWSDPNDETVSFRVYWTTGTLEDSNRSAADSREIGTATTYSIDEGIDNGTTYNVAVSAIDAAGNESILSSAVAVTAQPSTDFWEHYQDVGGPDTGGFCFIATVSYGSPMASELTTLRSFRDRFLLTSELGRAFVKGYYRWGRFAAAWIHDKPVLKSVTRVLLAPLIGFSKLAMATSLEMAFGLVAAGFILMMLLVRSYRQRLRRLNPGAFFSAQGGAA